MDVLNSYNQDLHSQINALIEIVKQNKLVAEALSRSEALNLNCSYYIGAGCITQSVWNYLSGFPLDYGIKDLDFVYYDAGDLSKEAEEKMAARLQEALGAIQVKVDVKNQARVHLWYQNTFGYPIQPYQSLEEAINTWPTTASAVAVRKAGENWKVYAPFGLNDLFGLVVRANQVQITKEIYDKKVRRWTSLWPQLKIIPWVETDQREEKQKNGVKR